MENKDFALYYTDENVIRIVAALVIAISSFALITKTQFAIFFLMADFGLRAFTFQTSPLAALAKVIVQLLKLKPNPIFAAPKRFAASIGFVFSLAIFVLMVLHFNTAAYYVGGILIFCAVLESVFKICLGCYVFSWFVAPFMQRKNKTEISNDK